MTTLKANDINRLVGEFMTLYEQWEDHPAGFSWASLQALAQQGAQAYNEGYGPSFHILTFDGYPHGEFHERLLGYLLAAGFDPFKTVSAASGLATVPVFGHESLREAALENPYSARMLATLNDIAREKTNEGAPCDMTSDI